LEGFIAREADLQIYSSKNALDCSGRASHRKINQLGVIDMLGEGPGRRIPRAAQH